MALQEMKGISDACSLPPIITHAISKLSIRVPRASQENCYCPIINWDMNLHYQM